MNGGDKKIPASFPVSNELLYELLPQLPRQILRFQMRVPAQHAQILVAGDAGHLHDIEAFLEQAGGGFVA